jgi:hypothetical protein
LFYSILNQPKLMYVSLNLGPDTLFESGILVVSIIITGVFDPLKNREFDWIVFVILFSI